MPFGALGALRNFDQVLGEYVIEERGRRIWLRQASSKKKEKLHVKLGRMKCMSEEKGQLC